MEPRRVDGISRRADDLDPIARYQMLVLVRSRRGSLAVHEARDRISFGEGELVVRKPRAPAMSKEAMRQESERLVREAMARNVTITRARPGWT